MKTLDNPHGVKFEVEIKSIGLHFYVPPIYKTRKMLCTQCLRPQNFSAHNLISI